MAISAYIGIPGSGKSYEAVCNVIIPAFTSGRRVVTNIYGLQKDKITERYPDATGEIIVVDNDDVLKADFFPFKGGEGSFCQFGDLIVIDEAWRIFGSDKDMTAEKKSFIAEHRHFTHPETGISCDLVIVNQSLSNIARFLKDKIETTYRMRKLKALGLNNHYCIDVYSGHKIYKSNLVTSYRNKYNPDIFELYKSYEGNNGNEKQTDKRQSIWNSGKVRFFLVLFPLMFIGSGWLIYSFFSTFGRSDPSPDLTTTDVRDAAMFRSSAATPAPDTPSEPAEPPLSTEWRISGRMTSEGRAFVILVNGAGVLRADERMITFRLTPDIDEREFVTRYLGNMNIRIWTKKGVDFIAPYTPKEPVKPRYTWTYTPQYRSVAYLSDILGGYVSGSFNNSGAVISDDSLKGSSGASNYINRTGDILVYYGTKEDIAILKTLVTSLDTMSDEVVVSGYVFEVQTSQSDGSGILLAAKILSDKFNISVGAAGLDNFINIRTGSIDAIFNLLKTDSRFTVVSAPRLRVKNNASASFSVGSDVPVLGSVTVNNNTTTQSVEYRSSGVLFNVTPSIKSRTMDLKIQQQLSNFVTTETGVNNSPTLIKRDVTTEVSLADGDIILLGGLAEQKDSKASSGWSFFGSRTSESNKTDIMVMLQVRKVDRSRATPRSAARSGELFRDNLN
ncbi:putative phage secreted protein [Salmonella enterica subsp. enterica serovar Typhi]|nr:putative phage secreted protein [Salmonella enterica subsp. enterica serovar Typhi]CHP36045.1 putative phage secreted protein [Salmonella enterica subsp. enterica serovar Typhi]CRJ58562.1 putative phage secreted protein [Salmonella enterica subsp. enterica serovar Typhi]